LVLLQKYITIHGPMYVKYCRVVVLFVGDRRFLSHAMQEAEYFFNTRYSGQFSTVFKVRLKTKGGLKPPSVRKFNHSFPYVLRVASSLSMQCHFG